MSRSAEAGPAIRIPRRGSRSRWSWNTSASTASLRVEGTMERRTFIQTVGVAAAGGFAPARWSAGKRLDRIGLELYAVRREMAKDPDKTLAAVRAIGYTDVELLWSFANFG